MTDRQTEQIILRGIINRIAINKQTNRIVWPQTEESESSGKQRKIAQEYLHDNGFVNPIDFADADCHSLRVIYAVGQGILHCGNPSWHNPLVSRLQFLDPENKTIPDWKP